MGMLPVFQFGKCSSVKQFHIVCTHTRFLLFAYQPQVSRVYHQSQWSKATHDGTIKLGHLILTVITLPSAPPKTEACSHLSLEISSTQQLGSENQSLIQLLSSH
jgi:hypothetical protein